MVVEETALGVTNGLLNTPPELLARVEEYLDKGSLISYISCCKILRATGVRTLLSAYPVMLNSYADVQSFCDFMHADLSPRKSFLRSLVLDTPYPSPKAMLAQRVRLAHALINAPNLSQLELGRCLKDILERSPALFSAIQSLPSLKALNMEAETGSWPYVVLRLHNAPIKALEMGYLGIDTPDAFTRHASTLQELSVGARFMEAALGRITYANVHSFTWIGAIDRAAWDIAAMIGLFPNLVRLSAWMRVRSSPSALSGLLHILSTMSFPYDSVRAENRERQLSTNTRLSGLRYLSGDPSALYILSPDCDLAIISITDKLELWNCTQHIHDIVRDIQRPLGTLHLRYSPSWEPASAENLGTLPPDALPEKPPHLIYFFVVELFIPSDASPEKVLNIAAAWPILIGKVAPQVVLLHIRIERYLQAGGTFPTEAEVCVEAGWLLSLGTVMAEAFTGTAEGPKTIWVRTSWHGGHRMKAWTRASAAPSLSLESSRFVEITDPGHMYAMDKEVEGILSDLA